MAVFEWCGITCIPEMVWSWTLPSLVISYFRNPAAVSSDPPWTAVCSVTPLLQGEPQEPARDLPLAGTTTPLCPCKTEKLMMPNPCFYSGYIYEFFSATCGCSCSNDYYRNVKFLHTKNTDWRIPLFSNKHGFGLAEDFIKLQFTLPFALK